MVSYKSVSYFNEIMDEEIKNLFSQLMNNLEAMDKYAMSGSCENETIQMENFLKEYFSFKNIPGKYIVQGVKSFEIKNPLSNYDDQAIIKFPSKTSELGFEMTINELLEWQKSYVVYACNDQDLCIDNEFLKKALQGHSEEGLEAFQMKFVIRISTCPILMEFDGKILERKLNENWPNKIKLVSVTGIDFAGRIHDINDITTYIQNWKDVYLFDSKTNKPWVYHGRDFIPKDQFSVELNDDLLFNHLIRMSYIRLYACNEQNIEIVVETGIGLGVFAGKQIGIDNHIRLLSAKAIKYVIEEYGSTFKNIRAIIFAMPIFERDEKLSTYHSFVEIFQYEYKGVIPILIVDQDMHRLTVYIAKQGFNVSELNPADSHGVFGEYWQNFGPAVEEKLALTTLGLITQHHLFNTQYVLNINNYHFVNTSQLKPSDTILNLSTEPSINPQNNQSLSENDNWFVKLLILTSIFYYIFHFFRRTIYRFRPN